MADIVFRKDYSIRALITRPSFEAEKCVNAFSAVGILPFVLPMIEPRPLCDFKFKYDDYDYCILTSPLAVRAFQTYAGLFPKVQYVAVGETSAREIVSRLKVDISEIIYPSNANGENVMKLVEKYPLEAKRVLLPGAKIRAVNMKDFFTRKGAFVDSPALYETVPMIYEKDVIATFIKTYRINVVTFFSPSSADAFLKQTSLGGLKVVCIGGTTAKTVEQFGVYPIVSSKSDTQSVCNLIRSLDF
jgi:uroporphyrinogen-III synthase